MGGQDLTNHDVENRIVMQGNTIGFQTLDKKLLSTHRMLTQIGRDAIEGFYEDNGKVDADSLADLKDYTSSLDMLEDVPMFSEVLH